MSRAAPLHVQALNEEKQIEATVKCLRHLDPPAHEVIVVDGGSTDRCQPGLSQVCLTDACVQLRVHTWSCNASQTDFLTRPRSRTSEGVSTS